MNKNIKSISAAFICVILSNIFVSCLSISGLKDDASKISYKYETVTIDENLDYLETKIKYPKFEQLPELNKRIENTILSNWKSFKSYSKTEWNEIAELNNRGKAKLPPFEYNVIFEVSGNKNIVSVLINTYIFNGGAHGNTSLASFNYDTTSSKFINIQQASGLDYNEISSITRSKLYKSLIEDDKSGMPPSEQDSIREMINTGAFPQAGNFEIYTVNGSKIYVYFEPYSVAPYSYGIQKVQLK